MIVLDSPRRRRGPWRRRVWVNFHVAVGLTVAAGAVLFVERAAEAAAIRDYYGPFTTRVILGTLIVAAVEAGLWFFVYRHGGGGAQLAAGLMGTFLLLRLVIVPLLLADLGIVEFGAAELLAGTYLAVSHLAFAASGWDPAPS
jgi:hypothetical protein